MEAPELNMWLGVVVSEVYEYGGAESVTVYI